jgi:hypothetical protein
MHQIFAAFFAVIFSFGHAATAPRGEALQADPVSHTASEAAPGRQALANRYAGSACLSCRRTRTATTVSYRAH